MITTYDKEHDLLYIKLNDFAYDHSVEHGDIVIDYDKTYNIIGFRIFGAKEKLQ